MTSLAPPYLICHLGFSIVYSNCLPQIWVPSHDRDHTNLQRSRSRPACLHCFRVARQVFSVKERIRSQVQTMNASRRAHFNEIFASCVLPRKSNVKWKVSSCQGSYMCLILGDPGAVNGGARKINRHDERFHESLQGGVNFLETFRRADLFSSRPH